jgi:hypothetical protein
MAILGLKIVESATFANFSHGERDAGPFSLPPHHRLPIWMANRS